VTGSTATDQQDHEAHRWTTPGSGDP